MGMGFTWRTSFLILLSCMASFNVYAETDLPMFFVAWPLSWLLFVPVVALETMIAHRLLGAKWRQCLKLAVGANALSALAGITLACAMFTGALGLMGELAEQSLLGYVASLLVSFAHSVWLTPNDSHADSAVTFAAVALYTPFYFVSVWIETRAGWRLLPEQDKGEIKQWSVIANCWSYAITIIALLVWSVLV